MIVVGTDTKAEQARRNLVGEGTMSESKGDTTSSASEKPERKDVVLTLSTARNMLGLMRLVIGDVLEAQQGIDRLQPEHDRLFKNRFNLSWPQRSRRYEIEELLA